MSMIGSNKSVDQSQASGRRSWALGAGTCLFLAVVVGACGLGSGSDGAAPTGDGVPAVTGSVSADSSNTETSADPTTTAEADTTTSEVLATTTAPAATPPGGVSFASSIQPIITETCASCHTGDGPGTQHVRFDTADDVSRAAFAIAIVTETRFMPPWPASDESVPFDHDWSLTDEEIATILRWDDDGAPLDVDPNTEMIPVNGVVGLNDPDLVMRADGSYDGEFGQPDEYRCFVYDPKLTESTFVSDMEFIPQQTQVVHHAVGFVVPGSERAAVEERNGADGQGGWTCFGFSPGNGADLIFTWAPGTDPTAFPDGTGLEMEAGDFFVLQTHYHYDVEADADQSTFAVNFATGADVDPIDLFTYLAPAEIPCGEGEEGPLCDRDAARQKAIDAYGREGVLADALIGGCGNPLDAPDGFVDGVAKSTCTSPVANPGEIVSVFGHEHEIGASFKMTLNPDTPEELVLLDIPVWDFDWQLIYEPTDSIVIDSGDTIRIECTWDRALRDPLLEPAYVLWADGTNDEMCFSSVVTRPV